MIENIEFYHPRHAEKVAVPRVVISHMVHYVIDCAKARTVTAVTIAKRTLVVDCRANVLLDDILDVIDQRHQLIVLQAFGGLRTTDNVLAQFSLFLQEIARNNPVPTG